MIKIKNQEVIKDIVGDFEEFLDFFLVLCPPFFHGLWKSELLPLEFLGICGKSLTNTHNLE